MAFGDEKIQQVWEKGRVIPEFNPSTWRHDDYGKGNSSRPYEAWTVF